MAQAIPPKRSHQVLPENPPRLQVADALHVSGGFRTQNNVQPLFVTAHIDRPPDRVRIRKYQPDDANVLKEMLMDFQKCMMTMDPEQRTKRDDDFGSNYLQLMLRELEENSGTLIVCVKDGRLVGFSASLVCPRSSYDDLEFVPERIGRITELYVIEELRGNGIGGRLLRSSEDILRSQGCTRVEIGVMSWNPLAHLLYKKNGYAEQFIRMAKPL
jgi:ribosomal protein S18 acetylase RimI-like enzyme